VSGELRAVLTEAIKAHKPTTKRINHPRRQEFLLNLDACMGCEWTEQDGGDHDSHVADVIASLPGVAVIQLPEPDADHGDGIAFWTAQEVGVADGMVVARFDPGNEAIYYEPSEAWETVAALAAAAVVATGEEA